jgi:RNA polymerase sigma-70 factor (ECF subfamily)
MGSTYGQYPDSDDRPDEVLVMRTKAGDQDAFVTLFLRYKEETYIWLIRLVHNHEIAMDLCQDTYVKAWTRIQSLYEPSRFKAWLLALARNLAFDWLRQNGRERTSPLEENGSPFDLIDYSADPTIVIETDVIRSTLANMEPHLREVLLLHTFGYSRAEIAHRLGYQESTIASYLSHARKQFRQLYRRQDHTNDSSRKEDGNSENANKPSMARSLDENNHSQENSCPEVIRETSPTLPPDLAAALENLHECFHLPLTLSLVYNQGPTEIAQQLGLPLGTIKSWLSRGKHLLASYQQQSSDSTGNDRLAEDHSPVCLEGVSPDQGDHSLQSHSQQEISASVSSDQFPTKLRPRYREVLLLQEVQHLSCAAIAQRLQIDEGNAKVLLYRARQQRKALLQQERQNGSSRRLRNISEENLQKLLCGDPFFQRHFYPPYADILCLAYGKGLTDQDIAARLGLPLGTAKCRLSQAVSYLNSFQSGT